MELVKQTRFWIEDVSHTVSYDSWDQFMIMGEGLRSNWSDLVLLSWGCKEERQSFTFQITYINLQDRYRNPNLLPAISPKRFEIKCVIMRIKEKDVPNIKDWITKNNPDLWRMKFLTEKVESPC